MNGKIFISALIGAFLVCHSVQSPSETPRPVFQNSTENSILDQKATNVTHTSTLVTKPTEVKIIETSRPVTGRTTEPKPVSHTLKPTTRKSFTRIPVTPKALTREPINLKTIEPNPAECDHSFDCHDAMSVCYEKTCRCRFGFTRPPNSRTKCTREHCLFNIDCMQQGSNTFCSLPINATQSAFGTCHCIEGFTIDYETQRCVVDRHEQFTVPEKTVQSWIFVVIGIVVFVLMVSLICAILCRFVCRKKV